MKLHHIDDKDFYDNYEEVINLITRLKHNDPAVFAYRKKNTFIIMEKISKYFVKIYNVEITQDYIYIIKMEYDDSAYYHPIYNIGISPEFILKQDYDKIKKAKKEIKKYISRIEFQSNKKYIYYMVFPVIIIFGIICNLLK